MLRCLFLLLFCSPVGLLRAEKIVLVAGGGTAEKDAPATECALREPFGVEFNAAGEMIIVEMTQGERVLKVGRDGVLRVIAGTGKKGYSGDGGPATAATFNGIHNLVILPNDDILLADSFNHALRKIDAKTGVVTTVAGSNKMGVNAVIAAATGSGQSGFAGDGGLAKDALFSTLIQIAIDPAKKNLFVADIGNKRVRRIDLESWTIKTVAGYGVGGVPPDDTIAVTAPLVDPRSVTPDAAGGFYILERNGHALRYVNAKGGIRTVAGTGIKGLSGDAGPALQATMSGPKYTTLDRDGTVLICDAENHVIRRYDPNTGLVTRVAGTGKAGDAGVGGDPLQCELRRPHGVTVGPDNALYITDSYNNRILKIVR